MNPRHHGRPPGSQSPMTDTAPALSCERLLGSLKLADPVQSPDGRWIVVSVATGFSRPGRGPQRRLWLVEPDGGAKPVTDGAAAATLPRWAPDGSAVAFTASDGHAGEAALRLLDPVGRSVRPVGEIPGSIEDIRWVESGDKLLVLASQDPRAGTGNDPRVRRSVEPAAPPRHLYRVELATGATAEVGPQDLTIWEFDVDGDDVVAVASTDPTDNGWYRSFLARLDLTTRSARILYRPRWQIACPRLAPGGGRVAFLEGICTDRGSLVGTVMVIHPGADEPRAVAPETDVAWIGWRAESTLWFTARHGLEAACGVLSLDGAVDRLWRGEGTFAGFPALSADRAQRRLVAIRESLYDPPEVAALDVGHPDAGWRPLTSLNTGVAGFALPPAERIVWHAPDGIDIEGLLVRPRDAGTEPLPLVAFIHGGPSASWSYAFPSGFRHAALLAHAGYAVLLPNPRGSTGRGQAFAQAVVGDLGGAELEDTLAGVEWCVARGIGDGDRVGIIGASHGGFMAAWAVTQTHRFRAGVVLAGVSDYLSAHYTASIPALDDILFAGAEPFPAYLERSPIAHVNACRTPTLILHGERDPYCPVSQAYELYGALVEAGVETELVVYPREGHGWIEFDHQVDLWVRIRDWFARHLGTGG